MDDVIISRDQKNWILVVNASNRAKIVDHFNAVLKSTGMNVEMEDKTESTAMVAIQGPKVIDRMASLIPTDSVDIKSLKRYGFESSSYMLIKFTDLPQRIHRRRRRGNDPPAKMAAMAMKLVGGKDHEGSTVRPAGLGARDTLRMEAGMPLYGPRIDRARSIRCQRD